MIIPGLPLSGGLLDPNGARYIEMLFGANSLFNKGFVFIVTLLFVVIGYFYGIMTKSIKSSKDFTEQIINYANSPEANVDIVMVMNKDESEEFRIDDRGREIIRLSKTPVLCIPLRKTGMSANFL